MTGPVPMATGSSSPIWPLPAVTRRRWTFGAPRKRKGKADRRHAGVDMYAPQGSVVLAPESGIVVATQRFLWKDRHDAIVFQTDSGPVILLGEIEAGSHREFGHSIGSRVAAGMPIARVGKSPGGGQMLHIEMYTRGTRKNSRWYAGQAPPSNLLDPTRYLKTAKALDISNDDVDDDNDDTHDDDQLPNQGGVSPIMLGLLAAGVLFMFSEFGDG